MRQNNTVMFKLAGVFWIIQTILAVIDIFTEQSEGLAFVIGLVMAALYAVCAYGLFIGDTYKFYKSIKIFSIIIYVACGIVILSMFSIIAYVGGLAIVMMIVIGMLAAEYWSLTKLAGMADDNEPVDKFWYVPGVIYLVTIILSFLMVQSITSKYDINGNVMGGLISDNIVMLIFGTAMYFITGYAFYDSQKQAVTNVPPAQTYQQQSRPVYNIYNPNNMNSTGSANNSSDFSISNNANSNSEDIYSAGSYNLNGDTVGQEVEKKSTFTLKKD
ncbi:MAG: hypothetical protein IJ141_06955 [Lachnospiraceae bacterium]|nr:hypothetical protein [Lachnospiraceae bacterium]